MTLRLGGDGAITGCTSLENPDLTVSGLTISGSFDAEKVLVASGTAAAPSYTFSGDTDNGLYYAGTNSVGVSTAGTSAIVIDASQRVGIGTTSPSTKLHIASNGAGGDVHVTNGSGQNALLELAGNGNTIANGSAVFGQAADNTVYAGIARGAHPVILGTNGTERMRIDSSGRLLINHTADTAPASYSSKLQLCDTSYEGSSLLLRRDQNSSSAPALLFAKTRSTSKGGSTVVQDGDLCGQIIWFAGDGTDANSQVAYMQAAVDGTPGSNDMPGRLTFFTTADGATASTERLRIDSSGHVGIGTTDPTHPLHVYTSTGTSTMFQGVAANSYIRFKNSDNARGYVGYETKRLAFYADNGSNTGDTRVAFMDADGLKFFNDTAAANALDDYEEGTWSPTIQGSTTTGTVTYVVRNGKYTKIGNTVFWELYVSWNSGNGAGFFLINGLPYTVQSSTPTYASVNIGYLQLLTVPGSSQIMGLHAAGNTYLYFYAMPLGGGANTQVNYDGSASVIMSGHYVVN